MGESPKSSKSAASIPSEQQADLPPETTIRRDQQTPIPYLETTTQ